MNVDIMSRRVKRRLLQLVKRYKRPLSCILCEKSITSHGIFLYSFELLSNVVVRKRIKLKRTGVTPEGNERNATSVYKECLEWGSEACTWWESITSSIEDEVKCNWSLSGSNIECKVWKLMYQTHKKMELEAEVSYLPKIEYIKLRTWT